MFGQDQGDRARPAGAARPDRGARSLARAFAPVRAVSRILGTPEEPPGHSDPDAERSAIVACGLYVDGERQSGQWSYAEALAAARQHGDAFVWLGLHQPSLAEMAGIAAAYGLHELAVEDAVKAEQRPKLEQFGEVSFLVLRTVRYVEHGELTESSEVVEVGQILIFIGRHFVITVRHGDASRLTPVRIDLESKRDLLAQGPWSVAYAVADRVVDHYLEVAEQIELDLDTLEEEVFAGDGHGGVQRIYQMKRELVEFRRAVSPLQRPLAALTAEQSRVPAEVRRYFRDVQDHLSRTVEHVTAYDDLLNSILQARLAQVTVDQNNDMRKIAAWAGIAAVWTAIAGIYGMNFTHMPELDFKYGYPVVVTVMLTVSVLLYRAFRRNGWL